MTSEAEGSLSLLAQQTLYDTDIITSSDVAQTAPGDLSSKGGILFDEHTNISQYVTSVQTHTDGEHTESKITEHKAESGGQDMDFGSSDGNMSDGVYDDYQPPSVALNQQHRNMSSSYEDIYVGAKLPGEDEDIVEIPSDTVDVGDKFDTKHHESVLLIRPDGKSSSFENLYEESMKESQDIEEKDVDEKEDDDIELFGPEKGESEDEKISDTAYIIPQTEDSHLSKIPEESECHSKSESDLSLPLQTSQASPIDGTYESGLDHIGHTDSQGSDEKDLLERSQSYEVEHVTDVDSQFRQRHYSSPDEMQQRTLPGDGASSDKGTYYLRLFPCLNFGTFINQVATSF